MQKLDGLWDGGSGSGTEDNRASYHPNGGTETASDGNILGDMVT
jgi:hypothetical protein